MNETLTELRVKTLIGDYMRAAGYRGKAKVMQDIIRHTRGRRSRPDADEAVTPQLFTQRTLENWLRNPAHELHPPHFAVVLAFVQSEHFRRLVPHSADGPANNRLISVADGLASLYGYTKGPPGVLTLRSTLLGQGMLALKLLSGSWVDATSHEPVPQSTKEGAFCKIIPIEGKRYGKLCMVTINATNQMIGTGVIVYVGAKELDDSEYCHLFVVNLWRRRDIESELKACSFLVHWIAKINQPELGIIKYSDSDGSLANVLELLRPGYHKTQDFKRLSVWPSAELEEEIDMALRDVLPHGLAEA